MGGSDPEPEMVETELSREQLKILNSREEFYQNTTRPEMKEYFQKTKEFEMDSNFFSINPDDAGSVTGRVFDNQQGMLAQSLSQRGTDPNSVNEQFGAQRNLAQAGSTNQALVQSILQKNTNIQQTNENQLNEAGVKQGGINMLLSQSPQSTQAAPVFFRKTPPKTGMVAQIGQSIMGAMGSMGSMPGMGGGGGGGGGGGNMGGLDLMGGGGGQGGGLMAPSGGQSSMMG